MLIFPDVFKDRWRTIGLCALSVVLLVLSFPRVQWTWLAFVALIPWLTALDGKNYKTSFRLSYLCGWGFFALMFYWIALVPPTVLTFFGFLALVSYLALYFGMFGLFYTRIRKRTLTFRILMLPSFWVILEYVRGHFLSGFGWGSLCHSQYNQLGVIQIADVTGMAGVSFVIVMVNVFLKACFRRVWDLLKRRHWAPFGARDQAPVKTARFYQRGMWRDKTRLDFVCSLALVAGVMALVAGYGRWCWARYPGQFQKGSRVAVVQGNIPQTDKLDQTQWDRNYQTYADLTQEVTAGRPDLIVWPETALPGYMGVQDSFAERLETLAEQIKIPVLAGTVERADDAYYNVALLMSSGGKIVEKYRKLHLVPFGEFIPLRRQIPFLSSVIPIGDFTSGTDFTVFNRSENTSDPLDRFAVQICFEDSVAPLVRAFVNRGAEFLINITNDAWFQDTKAPFLHLQSSVMRAVENRKTVVRAANTGVSCFIDPLGKIYNVIAGPRPNEPAGAAGSQKDAPRHVTFVKGTMTDTVFKLEQSSFYARFGDVFIGLCGGLLVAGGVRLVIRKKE
jgi:apolipoprotein N-acyltransferase